MYSAIHDIDDEPNVKDGERMLLLCVYLPVIIGVTSGVGYFHITRINSANNSHTVRRHRHAVTPPTKTIVEFLRAMEEDWLICVVCSIPFSPSSIAISVGLFSTARVDFGEKTAIALTAQPFGDCILILTFCCYVYGMY
ncbi:hypothetical protein HanRHA438_Chr03g0102871 [Helianthus annuus]|nr:hypothetical protein HanRHA438_Chr03g0102871 [Helianthus annuus]